MSSSAWDNSSTYEKDISTCERLNSSSARMQCRRDAEQERENRDGPGRNGRGNAYGHERSGSIEMRGECRDCGTISDIRRVESSSSSFPLGGVIGGVAGGLLGNQVGKGTGKTVATIAGVVGGAYVGDKIESSRNSDNQQPRGIWRVSVRMNDGRTVTRDYDEQPRFYVGDSVIADDAGNLHPAPRR